MSGVSVMEKKDNCWNQLEASEAAEMGRPPEHVSRFYAKGALQVNWNCYLAKSKLVEIHLAESRLIPFLHPNLPPIPSTDTNIIGWTYWSFYQLIAL